MEPLEAREGSEVVNGSVTVWRPWQLKQFELFQAVTVSTSSRQQFTQEYLIISGQSGTISSFQYRNAPASSHIAEGKLLVIEPGETWTSQIKDVTSHHLFIDPAWLQQFATEQLHWEQSLPHFPSQTFSDPSLSRTMHDLGANSLAPASRLQQEELLLRLFAPLLQVHAENARALPQLGREHPAVKRVKEYLQVHYAQEVSLQELAGVANLSPFHLARVFRQTVGVPPHAYQTQLCLTHARTLLAQGFEVGYVAHETGFADQSHFTRQFKRYFLVPPGSYRKTTRLF